MAEKIYKEPDRFAPRYRPTVFSVFKKNVIKDKSKKSGYFYRLYKQFPNLRKYTKTQIRQYVINFNRQAIMPEVLNTREGVDLPGNLGVIFLGTACHVTPENMGITLIHSGRAGKAVPFNTIPSCGNIGHIYYTNTTKKIRFDNARYWGFQADRIFNCGIGEVYPANYQKYVRISKLRYISSLVRSSKTKDYIKEITQEARKQYDELQFDIE